MGTWTTRTVRDGDGDGDGGGSRNGEENEEEGKEIPGTYKIVADRCGTEDARKRATTDPRLLPVGNPFKYHVPSGFVFIAFVMYITTTMCDGVLHCLWLVFIVFLVSLHGD